MIQLHGVRMSRATRCLWMLEELGLRYESLPVSFVGDVQKPEYKKLNPNARIPTLVDDDGTVIWESMAINLYLAKKYDKGLMPKSLVDECHAIKWSFWAMTEVEPHLVTVLMHRMFLPPDQRDAKIAETAIEKLNKPFAVLDAEMAERKYLVGDGYSVADVNVASVLGWVSLLSIDVTKFANLKRWLDVCTSRPACKKARGLMGS